MSHPEQMAFVRFVRDLHPGFFRDVRVLEVGSRNVNGSVRQFFVQCCDYVGIDCTAGPDVDVVTLAHEYKSDEPFDTVITCEALEHDPYWPETLRNCIGMLRPGGLFVGTWAAPKREEHGTGKDGGEVFGPNPGYYSGISPEQFAGVARPLLRNLVAGLHRAGLDVYAYGFRR